MCILLSLMLRAQQTARAIHSMLTEKRLLGSLTQNILSFAKDNDRYRLFCLSCRRDESPPTHPRKSETTKSLVSVVVWIGLKPTSGSAE